MHVLIKRKLEGPSIPELGQPTSTTFDSVVVPLNRPTTGPAALVSYELQRSLNGTTWETIATGPAIFGNPPAQYVDGGRTALTTYRYRARATDAAGRVSDFCSPVSVITADRPVGPPPPPVDDWRPNFPALGGGYIKPWQYSAPANYSKLAPLMVWLGDHYPYVESSYGSLASHFAAVKALKPPGVGADSILAAYTIHSESFPITDYFYADVVKKLTDENWFLRVTYPDGAIVSAVYDVRNPEINDTEYAHLNDKDANGKSWLIWHAEYINRLNVTGGSFPFPEFYDTNVSPPLTRAPITYTVSANPYYGAQYIDNVFWHKKVAGDYNQDGVAESPTDPLATESESSKAYRVSVQRGYVIHATRLRELSPNVRVFGNMDFFQIAGYNIYLQNYTPDFTRLGELYQVMDGGLAAEYWLTDAREPFSLEWQRREDGLIGFWCLVNIAKIMHGAVRFPRMCSYKCNDILHDGTAADLQRLRFAIGTVCVLTNGLIDDTGHIAANSAWHPYYTNNGAGHGWLGQPINETPSWTPYQNGVYVREFTEGFVGVNPRNNGARTIALGVNVRNIDNGATYAAGSAIPIADRDGLLLVKV